MRGFAVVMGSWAVDGVKLTMWDVVGGAVALLGMAIIIFAPKSA